MTIKKDHNSVSLIKERIKRCLNDQELWNDPTNPSEPPSRKNYLRNSSYIILSELTNLLINAII